MAGQLTVTAYTGVSGPIADGRAGEILDRYDQDVRQAIGDRGTELLRAFPMNKTGRSRGGFQANLHTVDRGAALAIPGPMIRGVTWSPWLEGISRRNQSTRFKGYHLFRRTRLELDRQAGEIADRELQKYLPQLGGG